ncbi:hypothetical protein ACSQ67_017875 [Phaseolus vulgaris]
MGNTCRGSLKGKYIQGFSQPEDHSKRTTTLSDRPDSDHPSSARQNNINSSENNNTTTNNIVVNNNNNNNPPFTSKKDSIMRRGLDNQAYYVLGHKTPNIRQVFTDVVGSPYYVAPEVLLKHYGPEADVWTAGVILYILLSGVPPFWAETQQGIFDAVLKGHIDFDSEPWPLISDSGKDLIRKMLCSQPSERLSAHQVLCHPWICENGVAPDRAIDPAVLSRLKQFSAMNKLKKMALRVIAESLSEEEIAGLREMFQAMDTDNSGAITFDELKAGLRRYGSTLKDIEIRDLMEAQLLTGLICYRFIDPPYLIPLTQADVDKSGTIDYGEFIAATVHLNKLEREEHLIAAFQYFDKDGSGYITVDELQQACAEHNMTDAFLEDIIREVDQDNDGRIDYGEFAAMMQKGNVGIGRRTMRNSLNLSMRDASSAQ